MTHRQINTAFILLMTVMDVRKCFAMFSGHVTETELIVVVYLPSGPCPRCATPPPSCSGSTPQAAPKSGPAGYQEAAVSEPRGHRGATAWRIKDLKSSVKSVRVKSSGHCDRHGRRSLSQRNSRGLASRAKDPTPLRWFYQDHGQYRARTST